MVWTGGFGLQGLDGGHTQYWKTLLSHFPTSHKLSFVSFLQKNHDSFQISVRKNDTKADDPAISKNSYRIFELY